MKTWILISAITLSAMAVAHGSTDDALDAAKSLYSSASYEEALSALDKAHAAGDESDEATKYRALCLLGLNRAQDAEQTIEQLITRRPEFKADGTDSPKLQALIATVRTRVLPAVATKLYENAKTAFDHGDLDTAAGEFARVVTLASDPEVASQPAITDLKMLADGFAKLADQERLLKKQTAAAKAADAPPARPTAPAANRIYDETNTDVMPPVALEQSVPHGTPANAMIGSRAFNGTIALVVDERGGVESVTVLKATIVSYDQQLLAAARKWHYRPASRAGQPVKYRKLVNVTLQPEGQ